MEQLKIINQQEVIGKDVKIYGTKDNPLFLAKDVAEWIDYSKTSQGYYNVSTMLMTVDEEEKCTITNSNSGGKKVFLTEDGLYEVLMQSRKPIAKAFKKEVKKILKQIRQTGGYIPTNEEDDDETIMAKALLIANKTIEKHKEIIANQRKQLEEQQPMVDFANAIAETSDSIDVGTFSKLLKDENVFVGGRNKLFQWLRDNKFLMKDNEPYQKYINNGVFEYVEYTYKTPYGEKLGHKTKISPKGQIYLVEKLRKIFK